jgi:hypothetical protein
MSSQTMTEVLLSSLSDSTMLADTLLTAGVVEGQVSSYH